MLPPRSFAAAPAVPLLVLAAAVSPSAAQAQGQAPLGLEDCVRLAEAAPSPAAVARRQGEIAAARASAARAGLLPRLALVGGYVRNSALPGQPDSGSFVSLNGVNQYTGMVTLTEEVDLSGRLRAAGARARADQQAADANYRISRRDLRRAVTAAYHRLLLARRLGQVAEEALTDAQQFAARTEILSAKGEAARADVVKAASQVEFLRQARRAAALEASLANQELAAFWTEDVRTPLDVVDVLDDPPPPLPAAAPLDRRPELALLLAQRQGLEADARAAHAARYPQANVTAEYGIDANRVAWDQRGYAVLVNLVIPLFDWSAAANAARQLSLQAEQLQVEVAVTRRALARDYGGALERAAAFQEEIAMTERQVSLSEQNLKLARVRYEGGEGSALDVVSAQGQLAQARANRYQAIVGRLQAAADLAAAGAP